MPRLHETHASHDSESYSPLLTVREVAAMLRVHRTTVYRLGIPGVKVGERLRFRLADVTAYLERATEGRSP